MHILLVDAPGKIEEVTTTNKTRDKDDIIAEDQYDADDADDDDDEEDYDVEGGGGTIKFIIKLSVII